MTPSVFSSSTKQAVALVVSVTSSQFLTLWKRNKEKHVPLLLYMRAKPGNSIDFTEEQTQRVS